MKYKELPNYLLILASTAYSSYVVYHFFIDEFGQLVSIAAAFAASFFAHYYLVIWMKSIKNKKGLHGSMFLALVLFSMVFTFEWIGTSVLAEKAIVKTERLDQLKQQSQALTGKILNLKSYKNWRDISARQDYTKQQESLQKAIEKEEATVIKQQEKATEKAFHFRFISVVLAVVSAIATLLSLEEEASTASLDSKTYSMIPQQKSTNQQVLQQDLSVYNQVKVDKSLIDLPAQERINRASEYIKETGEVDQRRIMPMFHLNPIQVGKAKKLAGVATKKSTSNSQGVIGFN
jgi:hypothetical protein